ncbi:hypothetical protein [Sinorhizobium fredii]|uniref:hypothetical protein n=1 Tax=Rhizobium fredii TaxID=380 RepID=UPI0013E8E501|nr:hypothetical protein [Sinorhizobium fredii]
MDPLLHESAVRITLPRYDPVEPNRDKSMAAVFRSCPLLLACGRPLDRRHATRDKDRHENGYLHYLPEDYSLAIRWPGRFRLPKSKMTNVRAAPGA